MWVNALNGLLAIVCVVSSHGFSGEFAGGGCASDTDCDFEGAWRCCGQVDKAENCPKPNGTGGVAGHCVLPGELSLPANVECVGYVSVAHLPTLLP
jgi:hypothetical protein